MTKREIYIAATAAGMSWAAAMAVDNYTATALAVEVHNGPGLMSPSAQACLNEQVGLSLFDDTVAAKELVCDLREYNEGPVLKSGWFCQGTGVKRVGEGELPEGESVVTPVP